VKQIVYENKEQDTQQK